MRGDVLAEERCCTRFARSIRWPIRCRATCYST